MRVNVCVVAFVLGLAFGLTPAVHASDRADAECGKWFPDLGCAESGRYDGFSAPMAMPYLFEDPFITSGLQAVLLWQEIPERSIFQGGYVSLAALQIRLAVTDRLAIIATRDGYARFEPDLGAMSHHSGFADMSFGFKYALIDRPDEGFILTPHLRFEPDLGDHALFQGMGDGILVPGVSVGWRVSDRVRAIAALGAQIPLDRDANSTCLHYNLHLDYLLSGGLAPFVELNGIRWTSSGKGTARVQLSDGTHLPLSTAQEALSSGRFEGFDFANLGSRGVAGDDMLTAAIGARYRLTAELSIGISYERPITSRKDLLKQRAMLMASYEF